jgi:hypothetical protein
MAGFRKVKWLVGAINFIIEQAYCLCGHVRYLFFPTVLLAVAHSKGATEQHIPAKLFRMAAPA